METQRKFVRTVGYLALLIAPVFVGFSLFSFFALSHERGGWHPAPDEAVIVPLIWLGSLLIPFCGWHLLRARPRSHSSRPQPPASGSASEQTKSAQSAAKSGIWVRRILWLLAAAFALPIGLFTIAALGWQATRAGLSAFAVLVVLLALFGTASGLIFILWALFRAFRTDAVDLANPWPRRIVAVLAIGGLAPLFLLAGSVMFYLRAARSAQAQPAEMLSQEPNPLVQDEQIEQPQNAAAQIANLTDFTNATRVTNVTNDNRTFFVQGRVTDEQGNGLAGVTISANCGVGTLRRTGTTQTDDAGRYLLRFGPGMRMKNESTGEWGAGIQAATISSAKAGYFDANLHRQGDLLMADQLPAPGENVGWKVDTNKVVLPGQPFELNFVMLPSAAIEGELRDETGAPIVGWAVCLGGEKLPPSSSVFACVDTNPNGHFSLKDVPTTGRWWLTAYSHGGRKQQTRPGPEFRSPEFNLAEPGTHNFDAQLELNQADTPRVLNIKITHPK